MKLAGRDAGNLCTILEVDEDTVLIDGHTRRRYVNPDHLEPLSSIIDVDKSTAADDIVPRLPDL